MIAGKELRKRNMAFLGLIAVIFSAKEQPNNVSLIISP
jgi:hypothetical protein